MKPGATTRPAASIVVRPFSRCALTARMTPFAMPTDLISFRPVAGSMTRPPATTTSSTAEPSGGWNPSTIERPPTTSAVSANRIAEVIDGTHSTIRAWRSASWRRCESDSPSLVERAIHHVGVDEAERFVIERLRDGADDLEPELLPRRDGRLVGGDDHVELHRAKSQPARLGQAVLPHRPSDAAALGRWRHHERGVGDVGPAPRLIRLEEIGPDDFVAVERDVGMSRGRHPHRQRIVPTHVGGKRVGVAWRHHGVKDLPDGILVAAFSRSDGDHRIARPKPSCYESDSFSRFAALRQ